MTARDWLHDFIAHDNSERMTMYRKSSMNINSIKYNIVQEIQKKLNVIKFRHIDSMKMNQRDQVEEYIQMGMHFEMLHWSSINLKKTVMWFETICKWTTITLFLKICFIILKYMKSLLKRRIQSKLKDKGLNIYLRID